MAYRYPTIKVDGKTKLKHRHIAEEKIGRTLTEDEQVHHKNGNEWDSSPDNLEVLSGEAHRKLHADERLIYPRIKNCEICGEQFEPHPTKRKIRKTCSPVCANKLRSITEKITKSRGKQNA